MASCASAPVDAPPVEQACAGDGGFLADCLHGLAQPQKAIPCKWLYDETGSALFERICETPEYYPSRTERTLLAGAAPWLGAMLPPGTVLVEFGSGASRKTRMLLDAAPAIHTYVPIDISATELARAARAIASDYPRVAVHPLLGDFTREMVLPATRPGPMRLGFFPGSTLGNFATEDATAFLAQARRLLGADSWLLLGVDVAKEPATLIAAYDDAAGVTTAFNLNLLSRMNRDLGSAIDLAAFAHCAVWNGELSRIEMHLVSLKDQIIVLAGRRFAIGKDETIHTENAYKLDRSDLAALISAAGWVIERRWASEHPNYDLLLLAC